MRIRSVKPEFWTHPIMSRMPDRVRLLALALLNHADDHGYFLADPAIVRGACCPFREDLGEIREDLAKLAEVGWIDLGRHPEHGIIGWLPSWTKHQKVAHPKSSKVKPYCDTGRFVKNSGNLQKKLCLDQGSGIREQGREQGAISAPHTQDSKPTDFTGPGDRGEAVPVVSIPDRAPLLPDWLVMHRKASLGKERDLWEALWRAAGNNAPRIFDAAYEALSPAHQKIYYSTMAAWIDENTTG